MMNKDVRVIYNGNLEVGENPLWNFQLKELIFTDILGKSVYIKNENCSDVKRIRLPQKTGCAALCDNGDMLLGLEDGVYRMNISGEISLAHREVKIKGERFNDGKVGPDDAFYLGCADKDGRGAFYRLRDGHLEELFDGCTCSNGIDWTLDNRTMYYIDSPRQMIEAFDFDISAGTLSNRRKFADIPCEWGLPDGMTLDAEDNIWVALWGGSRVIQIDKNSRKVINEIALPCPKVSSCAFGGKDLSELYITTAAKEDIESYPQAGGVFAVSLGVKGKKINYYKG